MYKYIRTILGSLSFESYAQFLSNLIKFAAARIRANLNEVLLFRILIIILIFNGSRRKEKWN